MPEQYYVPAGAKSQRSLSQLKWLELSGRLLGVGQEPGKSPKGAKGRGERLRFEDPRCECCKDSSGVRSLLRVTSVGYQVPLSSLYKMEIHKNCFGGGGGTSETRRAKAGQARR